MITRKLMLAAAAAAGLALFGGGAASAHGGGTSVYVGTGGMGFAYRDGTYYDRARHRHSYRYPSDYQSYGYPLSWYRTHRHWDNRQHRDWYRGNRHDRGRRHNW